MRSKRPRRRPRIRDEFFQLRTLSPDPNGEDLIEPIRLPESILAEDRLDELFEELPDGAYEIDYVIGNSDERMILRVDLRGGKAIILKTTLRVLPWNSTCSTFRARSNS